jgi:hypothetical protein
MRLESGSADMQLLGGRYLCPTCPSLVPIPLGIEVKRNAIYQDLVRKVRSSGGHSTAFSSQMILR